MFEDRFNRRGFFGRAGKYILLASAGVELTARKAKSKPRFDLPKLEADTERQGGDEEPALPPSQRIGFAVVGLGTLALEQIIPAFGSSKKSKLTALVSGHPEKAKAVARENGLSESSVYSYENFDSIKDNREVDIVYIVLPNSMHAEFTARAARAGKHVLSEKPMATSSADCRKMIDVCKNAGKKLMIAYRIQYEPMNKVIQQVVASHRFGAVKMIAATNCQNQGDVNQWRHKRALAGGGALPDIGIYCLNTIRAMLGEEPNEVFASTYSTPGDPRFTEVEETIAFNLRFPSGIFASCNSSYGAHESRNYRVFAEKGWFGMDPAFAYSGLKMEDSFAKGDVEYRESPKIQEKNQFALEMDHMADCVINDKVPHTPGEEGLRDQVIMEALYESAAQNRPVLLKQLKV